MVRKRGEDPALVLIGTTAFLIGDDEDGDDAAELVPACVVEEDTMIVVSNIRAVEVARVGPAEIECTDEVILSCLRKETLRRCLWRVCFIFHWIL